MSVKSYNSSTMSEFDPSARPEYLKQFIKFTIKLSCDCGDFTDTYVHTDITLQAALNNVIQGAQGRHAWDPLSNPKGCRTGVNPGSWSHELVSQEETTGWNKVD